MSQTSNRRNKVWNVFVGLVKFLVSTIGLIE
jgi:hypothetical protein